MSDLIKYIYHLSDIHIRPLQRHTEYIKVFKNFAKTISTEKNESIIIICGDIFHVRDKLLSETLIVFNEMIKIFQEHVEHIFIIPGNHDSFKSNERLDSIFGITHIKEFNNLSFLHNSCILEYKNLNIIHNYFNEHFYTYSEYQQYILENDLNKENMSICLYHGIVHKDSEEYYGKTYRNISDFEGYSFTLLGDIHEHSFLKNNIAYSGSLIQQDYSESNSKGYILWELYNNSGVFYDVKNIYSYITINVENGILQNLDSLNFSKYSNIRLVLDKCVNDYNSDFFEEIKNILETKTTILSITKTFKNLVNKIELLDNKLDTKELMYSNETDAINEIVNKLCGGDEQMIKKLYDLHYLYKNNIDFVDKIYTSNWKIESIKFKNIFIYGEDKMNEINFQEGITGILGNNAIGKSCILYIIIYCLFGQITKSKNYNNRNIIYKNAKNYYVEMVININDSLKYKIIRKGKNRERKTGISLEETINFFKIEKDIITDISLMTKTDTEKLVKEILGITNKEDFIFTNIISNILYKNVLTISNAEFEEILTNLFNTKIYKELFNYTKNIIKNLTTELNVLQGKKDLLEKQINDTSEYIDPKVYSSLKLKKNVLESKLKPILVEYRKYAKYNEIFKEHKTVDNINNKILLLENKIQSLSQNFKNENTDIEISERQLVKTKIKIQKMLKENEMAYIQPENYSSDTDYSTAILEIELDKITTKMDKFIKEHELLSERPENYLENVDYSKCILENDIKIKDCYIKNLENDKEDITLEYLEKLKNNIQKNDSKAYKIELYKLALKLIEDPYNISKNLYFQGNSKLKNELLLKNEQYTNCRNYSNYLYTLDLKEKSKDISLQIQNYNDCKKYSNYLDYLKLNENYNTIKTQLNLNVLLNQKEELSRCLIYASIEKQKEEYTLALEEVNSELLKYNINSENKEKYKIEYKLISEKYFQISEEININTVYKNLVSDKYLPKLILSNTISKLQEEANEIIFTLSNIYINFEITDSYRWNIIIKKNNMTLGPEQCSGYERFIINTALKIVFDKYKFYSGIKMFFIDEGLDCISEENYDKIDQLFELLKRYYNTVLIISHNETLKKKVENIISITSDFKCSFIS